MTPDRPPERDEFEEALEEYSLRRGEWEAGNLTAEGLNKVYQDVLAAHRRALAKADGDVVAVCDCDSRDCEPYLVRAAALDKEVGK